MSTVISTALATAGQELIVSGAWRLVRRVRMPAEVVAVGGSRKEFTDMYAMALLVDILRWDPGAESEPVMPRVTARVLLQRVQDDLREGREALVTRLLLNRRMGIRGLSTRERELCMQFVLQVQGRGGPTRAVLGASFLTDEVLPTLDALLQDTDTDLLRLALMLSAGPGPGLRRRHEVIQQNILELFAAGADPSSSATAAAALSISDELMATTVEATRDSRHAAFVPRTRVDADHANVLLRAYLEDTPPSLLPSRLSRGQLLASVFPYIRRANIAEDPSDASSNAAAWTAVNDDARFVRIPNQTIAHVLALPHVHDEDNRRRRMHRMMQTLGVRQIPVTLRTGGGADAGAGAGGAGDDDDTAGSAVYATDRRVFDLLRAVTFQRSSAHTAWSMFHDDEPAAEVLPVEEEPYIAENLKRTRGGIVLTPTTVVPDDYFPTEGL